VKGIGGFDKNVPDRSNVNIMAIVPNHCRRQLLASWHHPSSVDWKGGAAGDITWSGTGKAPCEDHGTSVSNRELSSDLDKAVDFDRARSQEAVRERVLPLLWASLRALVGLEVTNDPEEIDLWEGLEHGSGCF